MEYLDAGKEIQAAFESFLVKIQDVASEAELSELIEELDPVTEPFDQACFRLQDIAAHNGIIVDLNCDDDE